MAVKFWVTGGSYRDSSFSELAPGTSKVRKGPFTTYEEANKAWQALAWDTVDDALAQFHIEEEEIAGNVQEYWVTGGTFESGFETPIGTLERFGPYSTYADAEAKWAELAWQTVDDASARYRIDTLKLSDAETERLAYRLLTGADDAAFCQRVSDALADGYELYGSPSIAVGPEGTRVCQAVLLPKE